MDKKTVLVAFGGASPEHEVSVLTAMQAIAALEESPWKIEPLYITKSGRWLTGNHLLDLEQYQDLKKLENRSTPCAFAQNELGQPVLREVKNGYFSRAKSIPVFAVLTAFHGASGENGAFQGVCETFNIPCTGSGVMGSAVGMNKVTAKSVCKAHKIPVVEGVDFYETDWVADEAAIISSIENLEYPVIVKPVHLGSSIGVKIVNDHNELKTAIETAFRYDAHLLVEKAISPLTEINCSILGTAQKNRASVCERPLGKEELLSFQDKYEREEGSKGMASADRVIPADISKDLSAAIQKTSSDIFRILSCSGLARLDFLVNKNTQEYFFNEINTIPGSFSFYLWKESGISFRKLLEELIDIALQEHQEKNGRILSYETNLLSKKAVRGIKGLKGVK
ncbi:MAG: D-alanine--D-alanine ligase [Balneolaceae bacterium]